MSRDELRIWAMERYLGHIAGRWIEERIKEQISNAKGNIDVALRNCNTETTGFGWCGYWGSDGRWDMNSFRSGIDAWYPDNKTSSQPDVHIDVKEIFEYVKLGKPQVMQLEMF